MFFHASCTYSAQRLLVQLHVAYIHVNELHYVMCVSNPPSLFYSLSGLEILTFSFFILSIKVFYFP